MNFVERLTVDLDKNGLQAHMISEIIDRTMITQPEVARIFDRDTSEYPDVLYSVVWQTCKLEALKYIDVNCPNAWFRAIFDPSDPIHQTSAETE